MLKASRCRSAGDTAVGTRFSDDPPPTSTSEVLDSTSELSDFFFYFLFDIYDLNGNQHNSGPKRREISNCGIVEVIKDVSARLARQWT